MRLGLVVLLNLFTGRVYQHDAYVNEISPEIEVERAHREEDRHETEIPSRPEDLLVHADHEPLARSFLPTER